MQVMTKEEFLYNLKHAHIDLVKNIAKELMKITFLDINLEQPKPNLVSTLYAVYYKSKDSLPENGILPPDNINTFSYKAHFNCPFSENSMYKKYYMLLADYFGYYKKFTRMEARKVVDDYFEKQNIDKKGTHIVYIVFTQLNIQFKNIKFGKSYKDRRHLIFYEVEYWKDEKTPVMKKRK